MGPGGSRSGAADPPRPAGERIRPVLTINKIDRCFLELQCEGEEAFLAFRRVIENANVLMATYSDEQLGDTQVYPEKGNVCFSAGLHNWAFTLGTFAKARPVGPPPRPPAPAPGPRPAPRRLPPRVPRLPNSPNPPLAPRFRLGSPIPQMYAAKFGVPKEKMMQKLWGDNYFDPSTKKWTEKARPGAAAGPAVAWARSPLLSAAAPALCRAGSPLTPSPPRLPPPLPTPRSTPAPPPASAPSCSSATTRSTPSSRRR